MDIRNLVDKGWSFDDILDEVKKEYAAESKRKNRENEKRAAEAEKLKRKASRAALMKAWRDYTLVVAKDITPADVDKLMAEIEENLVDFENTFEMINKYNLGGIDLGREIKSDDEKLKDFLRNLEKMF